MTKEMMHLTYQPDGEKESLPYPKFDGVYWQGIPEEGELEGKVVEINGVRWEIKVIGFQGTDTRGNVRMHPEQDMQEDVFMIAGEGMMWIWDGLDCGLSSKQPHELKGVIGVEVAREASFTMAIASYHHTYWHTEMEHLVLNVERNGETYPIEPVSTPQGFHHQTELHERSLYFVVKRTKV